MGWDGGWFRRFLLHVIVPRAEPLRFHKHFCLVNRISLGMAWSWGAGDTWQGCACSPAGTVPTASALCPDSTSFRNSSHVCEFLLRKFTFCPQTQPARCELRVLCRDADWEERGTVSPSPVTALVALVCLLRVLSLCHPQHTWSTAVPRAFLQPLLILEDPVVQFTPDRCPWRMAPA